MWLAGMVGGMGQGRASAERFVLTAATISSALSGNGVSISEQQVTLPTEIVAGVADPVLAVSSMERGRGHVTRVRMSCRNASECLPFYVSVRSEDMLATETRQPSQKAPMQRREAQIGSQAGFQTDSHAGAPILLRAGSHAMLLIDDDHLHMRLPVVCLENGALGAVIRVASGDHKQMYRAEVLDGSSLKGRL